MTLPEERVAYTLTLNQCHVSDEQMGKLLGILDKAAEEAASVLDW